MMSPEHVSRIEAAGAWAVGKGIIPASAMAGYGAAWSDNEWRLAPGLGIAVALSLYWAAAEGHKAPAARSEPWWSTALHQALVNIGLVLIVIPIPGLLGRFLPDSPVLAAAGWAATGLGAVFAALARHRLGRNWSREVRVAEGHELVRTGPYRYVRHPIYAGALLMYVGFALSSGRPNALVGLALIAAAYWRKIAHEERLLQETFGAAFEDYRRRSRALIPFLV